MDPPGASTREAVHAGSPRRCQLPDGSAQEGRARIAGGGGLRDGAGLDGRARAVRGSARVGIARDPRLPARLQRLPGLPPSPGPRRPGRRRGRQQGPYLHRAPPRQDRRRVGRVPSGPGEDRVALWVRLCLRRPPPGRTARPRSPPSRSPLASPERRVSATRAASRAARASARPPPPRRPARATRVARASSPPPPVCPCSRCLRARGS